MKFIFTAERIANTCSIYEYMGILSGNEGMVMSILPKMATDEVGEYIVKVVYDNDGDIKEYQNLGKAVEMLRRIPASKLKAFMEQAKKACNEIVNPPKGSGSTSPLPTEPPPLPGG